MWRLHKATQLTAITHFFLLHAGAVTSLPLVTGFTEMGVFKSSLKAEWCFYTLPVGRARSQLPAGWLHRKDDGREAPGLMVLQGALTEEHVLSR